MRRILTAVAAVIWTAVAAAQAPRSIQEFGVLPTNSPEVNRTNLQRAIDQAALSGGALYVEPVAEGYPVAAGIVLRQNVS